MDIMDRKCKRYILFVLFFTILILLSQSVFAQTSVSIKINQGKKIVKAYFKLTKPIKLDLMAHCYETSGSQGILCWIETVKGEKIKESEIHALQKEKKFKQVYLLAGEYSMSGFDITGHLAESGVCAAYGFD